MSIYSSIYIPRMSVYHTEESIKKVIEHYRIGTISHIDFTPINKKPGFGENVDQVVKSAFVHFSDPWLCKDSLYFQNRTYIGNADFWNIVTTGQPYKLRINEKEYWICLKNKSPVQRTMMNIHQVVENGRHLENLLTTQAEDFKNLKETVEKQEKIIEGLRSVVYQLVGGLYCQNTQTGILQVHLSQLFGRENSSSSIAPDTHPFGFLPTTRQGDNNSQRLDRIEHYIEHHILPEAKKCCHSESEDNENSSQIDTELLQRKYCGVEIDEDYVEEEYELIQEEKEKRMFRNHRI